MAERPDFCLEAKCPLYNSRMEIGCLLHAWIRRGWPSEDGRKRTLAAFLKKAKADPEQVFKECQVRLGTMNPSRRPD